MMLAPWSAEQATAWGAKDRWAAGCNFIPSTAINQLEMWQAETFDPLTIEREFALMAKTGMTRARIYLHDRAYEADPKGFMSRMRRVLDLAGRHRIRVMFVFFDDCWSPKAELGPQPNPTPGVHNSGWLRSPSDDRRNWPEGLPRLKTYVQDVLRTFARNRNVWMWDLYNEPGNSGYGDKSLPLLRDVFKWAWEVRPSQPLTAGSWSGGSTELDRVCLSLSDVISFHNYGQLDSLKTDLRHYKSFGKPVVCTEWMARTNGSRIATHLPVFREEKVSCLQWGFVSGKTNTIWPWGSPPNGPEPATWFHDLYRQDGTPFDPAEVKLYQELTQVGTNRKR